MKKRKWKTLKSESWKVFTKKKVLPSRGAKPDHGTGGNWGVEAKSKKKRKIRVRTKN